MDKPNPTTKVQVNGKTHTVKVLDYWYINGQLKATYICPYTRKRTTQAVNEVVE